MEQPHIPVRNLYYMLCYAWNHLQQGELVDVSRVPTTELVDLFALVLCDGIDHLARRGLEQAYVTSQQEIAGVRGRIEMLASARRFLPAHGRAVCSFDEQTPNTLTNQVLRSTLRKLEREEGLDAHLRTRVHRLSRQMIGVDDIVITNKLFTRIQLHANNRFYRFLLNVCELVHGSWLVDSEHGNYRFRDFVRDERIMATVFQNFLFNFIRIKMPTWTVRREHIYWDATSVSDPGLALLPRMETDISLSRNGVHKIIDAKYYRKTLAQRYDAEKVHSGHLFQLFSYLMNARRPDGGQLHGMLIYPMVEREVRADYVMHGASVTVATVDLNRPWEEIQNEIVELIG